jgi:hypothetical protein
MKRLIAGIALIVALFVSAADASSAENFMVDVGNLTEDTCTNVHVHGEGSYPGVVPDMEIKGKGVSQISPAPPTACFTDCDVIEDTDERYDCYMAGDLNFGFYSDITGSLTFNLEGLRRARAHYRIYHESGPPDHHFVTALVEGNSFDEAIPDIDEGSYVRVDVMWCPDTNYDETIDLFNDIMDTAYDYGCAGKPWSPSSCKGNLTDHDENDLVDLFNDTFKTSQRYGLACDAF